MFQGTVKLKLIEATELKPTALQTRFKLPVFEATIDPYVTIAFDNINV
jgi:hypothetical protein